MKTMNLYNKDLRSPTKRKFRDYTVGFILLYSQPAGKNYMSKRAGVVLGLTSFDRFWWFDGQKFPGWHGLILVEFQERGFGRKGTK